MMTSLDGLQMVGNYGESFTVWFEGTVLSVTHPPIMSLAECSKLPYFSIDNARVIYTKKGLNS